jgi:hypothetical protein
MGLAGGHAGGFAGGLAGGFAALRALGGRSPVRPPSPDGDGREGVPPAGGGSGARTAVSYPDAGPVPLTRTGPSRYVG